MHASPLAVETHPLLARRRRCLQRLPTLHLGSALRGRKCVPMKLGGRIAALRREALWA
jgi:hypothetical protein